MADKKATEDLGVSQVQNAVEEAQKVGYQGVKVDPLPNSAHSLESGPDAPTLAEQRAAVAKAEAETPDAKGTVKADA